MIDTDTSEPPSTVSAASAPPHSCRAAGGNATVDLLDPTSFLTRPLANELVTHARAALTHLEQTGEVRVRLVGDSEMSRLHAEHCDDPSTTDILTFNLTEPHNAAPLDVDLFLCVDEAARQAATRGHPVVHELLLYIVHGALHCLGYDDHTESDAAAMHAREDEILRAIGIGAIFRGGAA